MKYKYEISRIIEDYDGSVLYVPKCINCKIYFIDMHIFSTVFGEFCSECIENFENNNSDWAIGLGVTND